MVPWRREWIMVSSRYRNRSPVRRPTGAPTVIPPIPDCHAAAGTRAETVFQPIVEARTKAERLKSTLGVFERSKFFFNLPTVLGEAVEEVSFKDSHALVGPLDTDSHSCQGRYEAALQAYKKGRYLLGNRPEQLLGLPAATTPQQQQQQQRIYEKVWGQVEKIMGDLRAVLGKRLRDTKRGLDEVEKTIESVPPSKLDLYVPRTDAESYHFAGSCSSSTLPTTRSGSFSTRSIGISCRYSGRPPTPA